MSASAASDANIEHNENTPLLEADLGAQSHEVDAAKNQKFNPHDLSISQRYLVFGVCLVGVFLGALDSTIVATLLSGIASEFNELGRVQWVAISYLLGFASSQPLYVKVSHLLGRKPTLLLCDIFFGTGCLMSGLSSSFTVVVLGRLITGIGGGGIMVLSVITTTDLVSLRDRGLLVGLGNIAYGVGASSGGIVGGYIADTIGWRWAFTLQAPILALSFVLKVLYFDGRLGAATKDKQERAEQRRNIDWIGALSLVATIVAFSLGCSLGGRFLAWSDWRTLGLLLSSLVLGAFTVYYELFYALDPVFNVRMLAHPTVLSGGWSLFSCSASVFSILYFAPLYYQATFDDTSVNIGWILAFNFIGVALGSLITGIYMRRTGKYAWYGRWMAVMFLFGALHPISLHRGDSHFYLIFWKSLDMFLLGFGYVSAMNVVSTAMIAAVPADEHPMVTSIQYMFRGLGSTLGTSMSSAVFQNVLLQSLVKNVTPNIGPDYETVISRALESVAYVKEVPEAYKLAVVVSFTSAGLAVLWLASGFSLMTVLAQLLVGEHTLHKSLDRTDDEHDESNAS